MAKRVVLLLCQGAEIYEAGALFDVLGWSGPQGLEPVEAVTAGTGPEVRCTFGLRVIPQRLVSEIDPVEFDGLAIPGGFEAFGFYADAYSQPVLDLIRRFDALGKPIGAVCVAALPVARSGVLRGRRATTYHRMDGLRRRQLADLGALVVDAPLVIDANVITCTSPAAAMDAAFALLAQVTSPENASQVRDRMGFAA